MEEELEALQSVYDTLSVISGERTELSMRCQPRYSTSFVSAHIHIVLPTDYPAVSLHSFNIVKSSGLIDEGASIVKKVHEFLSSNVDDGEPILFQLFDLVFDCLNASNQGECLICAEELLISQGKQGQGLLTKCSHSFHTRCLSRWAAISMCQSQLRAQGSTAQSRDDRSFSSITLRFLHIDYSFIQPQHIIFKHSPQQHTLSLTPATYPLIHPSNIPPLSTHPLQTPSPNTSSELRHLQGTIRGVEKELEGLQTTITKWQEEIAQLSTSLSSTPTPTATVTTSTTAPSTGSAGTGITTVSAFSTPISSITTLKLVIKERRSKLSDTVGAIQKALNKGTATHNTSCQTLFSCFCSCFSSSFSCSSSSSFSSSYHPVSIASL